MKYYPVYLNMTGRRVVVVGAGDVAWQKIPALLESQADIFVVSPDAIDPIHDLAKAGRLKWAKRPYESTDVDGAFLVISSTDDPDVQKRVAADARAKNIWVNVVDVTPLCDFIAPAIIAQGDVQIAISTGGASPALASYIRKKLEPHFGPEYGVLTEALQRWRPKILKLPKDRRKVVWDAIINPEFMNRIKAEGSGVIEAQLQELVHE